MLKKITAAEKKGCQDDAGRSLVTIIDFRASTRLKQKFSADRYHVQTSCPEIIAQLDDFINNPALTDRIPRQGFVVCISETGKRDRYLQSYLYSLGITGITSLDNGMRGWLKQGYPTEKMSESGR